MSRNKKVKSRKVKSAQRLGLLERRRSLRDVEDLIAGERFDGAADALDQMLRRQPRDPGLLCLRVKVAHALKDYQTLQECLSRLLEMTPADPELLLQLAAAFQAGGRIALSIETYRRFLAAAPRHRLAGEIRLIMDVVEAAFRVMIEREKPFPAEADPLPLCARHDEILFRMASAEFAQVKKVAHALIERAPDFLPARNNLVEAHLWLGEVEEAADKARATLARAPANTYARCSLVRALFLAGRFDEARQEAAPLKELRPQRDDDWLKLLDVWSVLGEDERVLEVYELARSALREIPPQVPQLAGVAAARLGQDALARKLLQEAGPRLPIALENLEDLKKKPGEREGAWAFPPNNWLPESMIHSVSSHLTKGGKGPANLDSFLKAHPRLIALAPIFLERGGPGMRLVVEMFVQFTSNAAFLNAVKSYVLGERGTFHSRMSAAMLLARKGVLPAGTFEVFDNGSRREMFLMSYQIHSDVRLIQPRAAQDLQERAATALHSENGVLAEKLLRQAIGLAPEAPTLINNLVIALQMQKRMSEAADLTDELVRRFPDYFFSTIHLANRAIGKGDAEEALRVLHAVSCRPRLHVSEFRALATAHIDALVALDRRDAARQWLRMWRDTEPGHPLLSAYERRIDRRGMLQTLSAWLGR